MINAVRGQKATIEIVLLDAHERVTDVWDKAAGVRWELPPEMTLTDADANPLDAELSFDEATPEPRVVRVRLDADPDPAGRDELVFETAPITIAEPPPGRAVSGRLKVTLRQV